MKAPDQLSQVRRKLLPEIGSKTNANPDTAVSEALPRAAKAAGLPLAGDERCGVVRDNAAIGRHPFAIIPAGEESLPQSVAGPRPNTAFPQGKVARIFAIGGAHRKRDILTHEAAAKIGS